MKNKEKHKDEKIMASNFEISIHRNSENLHVKMVGDFDGNSVHELLGILNSREKRLVHAD